MYHINGSSFLFHILLYSLYFIFNTYMRDLEVVCVLSPIGWGCCYFFNNMFTYKHHMTNMILTLYRQHMLSYKFDVILYSYMLTRAQVMRVLRAAWRPPISGWTAAPSPLAKGARRVRRRSCRSRAPATAS